VVSAALKADSATERALFRAEATDVFALSTQADDEIAEVPGRPKFTGILSFERRENMVATRVDDAGTLATGNAPRTRPHGCLSTRARRQTTAGFRTGKSRVADCHTISVSISK